MPWPLAAAAAALLAGCAPSTERLYGIYTEELTAAGLLRLDRDPADAPFTDADLIANFQRVAFAVEAFDDQEAGERRLRRWEGPIRYRVLSRDPADREAVDGMMRRLAGLTGLDIAPAARDPNLIVFFIDGPLRAALARHLDRLDGEGARSFARALRVSDLVSPCHAGLAGDIDDGIIRSGYVIIKDEARGRLRQACIEEELAQAMGLTNDDPDVRPSIFNDDQEFALLTTHDEMLLRMLYHPLLRPGMSRAEAAPLLPAVLADIRKGGR